VIQFGNNPIKHHVGNNWTRDAFMKFLQQHRALHSAPAFDFEVLPIYDDEKPGEHKFSPKYTFGGFADKWHECPFNSEAEALDFLQALNTCDPKFIKIPTTWGEGKERDLAAARSTAVWPDATDAELMADKETLTAALLARRPALVAAFRAEIEAAGFEWQPSEEVAA
jgi:hypothetical protein